MHGLHITKQFRTFTTRFLRGGRATRAVLSGFALALLVMVPASAEESSRSDRDRAYDLGGLLDLAMRRNPGLQAAWSRALAAEAAVGEARASYWPRVRAELIGGSDQWYTPAAPGPDHFRRVQATVLLGVEYLLFDFGRRDADVDRTIAALESAGLLYQRRVQETVFNVQRAWFAHEAAVWQLRAAESAEKSSTANLQTIQREVERGLRALPDRLTAEQQEIDARFLRDAAANRVRITLGDVCVAVGLPANSALRLRESQSPAPTDHVRGRVTELIDLALQQRPDLAARAAEVREMDAATRRARADFYPELRIEGNYGYSAFGYRAESDGRGGTYRDDQHGYGAALVFSWELFDGFERTNRVRRLDDERRAKTEDLAHANLETTRDVWSAYHDYLTAASRVEYAEARVRSARETTAALETGFAAGLEDIATFESAKSLLARAEYERAQAVADFSTSAADLALAIGTSSLPPAAVNE